MAPETPLNAAESQALDALLTPARRAYRAQDLSDAQLDALWAPLASAAAPAAPRPRWVWVAAASVAAAGLALWVGLDRPAPATGGLVASQPAPTASAPSGPGPLAPGSALAAPTRLPGGAFVEPQGGVQVEVADARETRLSVHAGRVRSTVPPQQGGGPPAYVVLTPLAEVTVRGTQFTVLDDAEGRTTVEVERGVVDVAPRDGRPLRQLTAGQRHVLQPVTARGALAAEAARDWGQAAWLWTRLVRAGGDGLSARNTFLSAGLRLKAAPDGALAAAALVPFWAAAVERYPQGPHADTLLFEWGAAAHGAGDRATAQAVAERLRRDFPSSPRATETKRW